jgi:hypothetical protein
MPNPNPDQDVAALVQALAVAVQASGRSRPEIERTLGWSPGSLGQRLGGAVELRVFDLFDLLAAIGVAPADFFRLAFPRRAPGAAPATARGRSERLEWQAAGLQTAEPDDPGHIAHVRSTLLQMFSELGKAGRGEEPG